MTHAIYVAICAITKAEVSCPLFSAKPQIKQNVWEINY
jgi:hypothetical protein